MFGGETDERSDGGFEIVGEELGFKPCDPSPEDSETTEDDSVQSTSESEAEQVEDTRPEFVWPKSKYFINTKSLVMHCERTEGVLKCGRRLSPNYTALYELNGIRCSRCFDI